MNREAERNRLVELIENFFEKEIGASFVKGFLDKFADNILDDGWMRPPVKVGDRVYWIDDGEIKNEEVFEISIYGDGILVHTGIQFCLEQVFLTREEAEKALEGKEDEGK